MFSSLGRGNIVPKEIQDKDAVLHFIESADQFQRIVNESGLVKMTRLTDEEIIGRNPTSPTPGPSPEGRGGAGIIEQYFALSMGGEATCLEDICLGAEQMRIGDNLLCLHTLSDPDDLPSKVQTDSRYERLSTDRSDCNLSFAAPVGVMLPCNHIYSQWIFIDNHAAIEAQKLLLDLQMNFYPLTALMLYKQAQE